MVTLSAERVFGIRIICNIAYICYVPSVLCCFFLARSIRIATVSVFSIYLFFGRCFRFTLQLYSSTLLFVCLLFSLFLPPPPFPLSLFRFSLRLCCSFSPASVCVYFILFTTCAYYYLSGKTCSVLVCLLLYSLCLIFIIDMLEFEFFHCLVLLWQCRVYVIEL